jgi:hypothetical protein
VWRLANVVDIRVLKADPKNNISPGQLASAEVLGYPGEVALDDPKAVVSVRWYHECDDDGVVLNGYQNVQCNRKYYLPAFGEEFAEPITLVSNYVTIERIEMVKDTVQRGLWVANAAHLSCMKKEFGKRVRVLQSSR